MLNHDTMDVLPCAWAGLDSEFVSRLRLSAREDVVEGRSTTGQALRAKKPVWNNDLTPDPGAGWLRQFTLERGIRSVMSLPLLVGGEAEGAFVLYAEEIGFFKDEEITLLEEMVAECPMD